MTIENYTKKSVEAIEETQKLADRYGQQELQPEHLLYALLTIEESLIVKILMKQGVAVDALKEKAEELLKGLPRVSGTSQGLYLGNDLTSMYPSNIFFSD